MENPPHPSLRRGIAVEPGLSHLLIQSLVLSGGMVTRGLLAQAWGEKALSPELQGEN